MQTKPATAQSTQVSPALAAEIHSLRGGGQPLDPATRDFMEPHFGHDFSQVRVHTDARAAEMARSVNARAFTLGRDVVLGSGQHSPRTSEGKRLLAHELTHVVQQSTHQENQLQRVPKSPERVDLVFLMADGLEAEAKVLAPKGKIVKVSSLEEMKTALKSAGPIKTLFIISHSLPSGDLGFESGDTTTYIPPSKIAEALKGTASAENAPDLVDFRGCSIGTSPKAMDTIRSALGAKAAVGGNCFNISLAQGPIVLGDEEITKPSQVTADDRESFETGLKMLIDSFGDAKDCILDRSEEAYFRTGGKMVAQWFSPDLSTEWNARKSKCYNELTPEVVDPSTAKEEDFESGLLGHCRLIRVEK